MRGNGEIAHAGIQKLPGTVAQLVIIVHFTVAFQPYRWDTVYVQCFILGITNGNRRKGVLWSGTPWMYIKETGIVAVIVYVGEKARSGRRGNTIFWITWLAGKLFFHKGSFIGSSQAVNRIVWWENLNMHMPLWNRASQVGLAMKLSELCFPFFRDVSDALSSGLIKFIAY